MVLRFRLFAIALIGLGVAFGAWAQAARPATPAAPATSAAAQKFTHFRVGNKNVKRLFVDGDFVWVGTSGGVVRYDTRTDDYKLFDVKSGLLSNGVFHVGKLDGRRVHLIICDVNMPNMDGISFVKQMKTMPNYRFTPVIMLTTEAAIAEKPKEDKGGGMPGGHDGGMGGMGGMM